MVARSDSNLVAGRDKNAIRPVEIVSAAANMSARGRHKSAADSFTEEGRDSYRVSLDRPDAAGRRGERWWWLRKSSSAVNSPRREIKCVL